MVLDTRLLDIITQCIYDVLQWTSIIILSFFGFSVDDSFVSSPLSILFPLFIVTVIISLIFAIIKILRKFIWGV